MTPPLAGEHSATAALNAILSEILDVVQEVKQAHRKVPESHVLHVEVDRLFDDLRTWAGLLLDEDEALGGSPLSSIPTVAGRRARNLWPGTPSDEAVREMLDDRLGQLEEHLASALAEQKDESARTALADLRRAVAEHRQILKDA